MRPQLVIDGATAAHAVLVDQIPRLTAAEIRRPSLLTDWTVGHVLTHLARNADSHTGMLVAAQGGGIADQYPGGPAQRSADIAAGAARLPEGVALRIEAEGVIGAWG